MDLGERLTDVLNVVVSSLQGASHGGGDEGRSGNVMLSSTIYKFRSIVLLHDLFLAF